MVISPLQLLNSNPTLSPKEYFEEVTSKFDKAVATSAPIKKFFQMGKYKVVFCFSNSKLIPWITPAMAHIEIPACDSFDLELNFWDSCSTGISLDPPPWTDVHAGHLSFHEDPFLIRFDHFSEILHLYNREKLQGYLWFKDFREVPYYETAAPLRSLFNWWLQDTPYQLMHGGALATDQGGVLIMGPGGTGKSTTCSLAFRSSLKYLSDDFCLVDTGPEKRVYSIYSSSKLRPDVYQRFPELNPSLYWKPQSSVEKAVYLLFPHFKEKILRSAPLKALLIPKITGKPHTEIYPTSPVKALAALAPSTVFHLSGPGDYTFKKTVQLVKGLPSYQLALGAQLEEIPEKINNFINAL